MRLIGIVVGAALGLAVVAEGAYIVRTRSQLAAVTEKLDALSSQRDGAMASMGRGFASEAGQPREGGMDDGDGEDDRGARRLPPPRLVNAPQGSAAPPPRSDDPLPLPPAIDSPQAREQLRQFVLAQLERERQEAQVRQEERRQQREQERRDRVAKELGLSPSETEKFNQILNDSQAAREKFRDQVEAGQIPREGARQAAMAMRQENEQKLQGLLGSDRMKKYETLRGPPGGGPFVEGGRRGWGGGGQGVGRGGPGGGPPGGPGINPF
jgi:hypothetical protein